jgi:hypothetical protein
MYVEKQIHSKKSLTYKVIIAIFSITALWKGIHIKCTYNKRPMGHIAHLRNRGLYRNFFPISNMHFISICPI